MFKNNCLIQSFDNIGNNRFVKDFAQTCVIKTLVLGISFIVKHAQNFAGRTVSWILKGFKSTQKVYNKALNTLDNLPGKDEYKPIDINIDETEINTPKIAYIQQKNPPMSSKVCQSLVVNSSSEISLPRDLALKILELAKNDLPSLSCVNTNWSEMANDEELYQRLFEPIEKEHTVNGAKAYKEIYTKVYQDVIDVQVAEEFRLPKWIYRFLDENKQQFMITFITDKIKVVKKSGNVTEIVFDSLEAVGDFFKKPVTDLQKTCFSYGTWNGNVAIIKKRKTENAHWSIISTQAMHQGKIFSEQLSLVGNRISGLMDTAISILMVYAKSGCKERIFAWDDQTHQYNSVCFGDNDKTNGVRSTLCFKSCGLQVDADYAEENP